VGRAWFAFGHGPMEAAAGRPLGRERDDETAGPSTKRSGKSIPTPFLGPHKHKAPPLRRGYELS